MSQPSVLSEKRTFLSADSSLPSCLGIEQEDLVGLHIGDAFPPRIAAELSDLLDEHAALKRPFLAWMMVRGRWIMLLCKPVETIKDNKVQFVLLHATNWASWNACICDVCVHTLRHLDLGPLGMLTKRELEVFALIGRGFTTEQIASRLHRSKRTVQGHRVSLGRKLRAKTRGEITRQAAEAGLNELDFEELPILHSSQPNCPSGSIATSRCSATTRPECN